MNKVILKMITEKLTTFLLITNFNKKRDIMPKDFLE